MSRITFTIYVFHDVHENISAFPAAVTPSAPTPATSSADPTPALPAASNDEDLEYEDDDEEYDEEYEDNNLNTKASDPVAEPRKARPASIIHTTPKPVSSDEPKTFNQIGSRQKQSASTTSDKFRLTQTQNGVVNHVKMPEEPTTTEKIPAGFKGKVESAPKATPEPRKYHTRFLPSKHLQDMQKEKPDSFVTVTKSVTGSIDDTQTPPVETPHFGSTYYTKSSTCGYFTFSCNIVYGSNGRSKICRPKAPTNGKC